MQSKFERRPFIEHVGILEEIKIKDQLIIVSLSFSSHRKSKLIFPIFSPEAKLLAEQLEDLRGKRIGILITDNFLQPFRVRIINAKSSPTSNIGMV